MKRLIVFAVLAIFLISACTRMENNVIEPKIGSEEQATEDADNVIQSIDEVTQGIGEIEELTG